MGDNCKTFSVSRTIHFNAIFHFNGVGSFENSSDGQKSSIGAESTVNIKQLNKNQVLSQQIHNHMLNQFVIEIERRKITLMFWN